MLGRVRSVSFLPPAVRTPDVSRFIFSRLICGHRDSIEQPPQRYKTAKSKIHAMVKQTIDVEGYEAFTECVNAQTGTVIVLFSGSKDENGVSWCPDCITAAPVIERNIDKAPEDATFIHCSVGRRDFWKDPNNPFRKDPKFAVKCVPTLIIVGTNKRLEEDQLFKDDLLEMLFEDDS